MSDDRLNAALNHIDAAREFANRGLHGLAEDWPAERQAAAREILDLADEEMKRAADLIKSTQPGGLWGRPAPDVTGLSPYLPDAIDELVRARSLIERAIQAEDLVFDADVRVDEALNQVTGAIGRAVDHLLVVWTDQF
jgi:hypothetical protein